LQKETYIEDEIDLKELFVTIWKRKIFIATFTLCVTLCAGIYAYTKTPIYEVKSYIELGFIDNKIIEEPAILEQKLKVVFGIDNNTMNNNPEKGIITSVSQTKNIKNFLEIKTEAISNEIAIAKNKEVLTYTQNLYNPKIENSKSLINNEILNIERQIDFFENEKIKMLNESIILSNSNLEKYNKEITELYKSNINTNDKTSSMIASVQIINYQNLIINLQNQINSIEIEKQQIIKNILPKMKASLDEIKFKLSEQNISNTRLVGDYIVNEYPSKPKKSLIVVVSFVTVLILSIFIVFFMQFISNFREEENK
jgi:LPS O-antigen subunit length determinant protein (WzzB/FepE family)